MKWQKVSTCLKVFCEETVCALNCHPDMKNVDDTISFLSIIIGFWRIVNVHSPYTVIHMCDPNRAAIFSSGDFNLQKLLELGSLAKQMCSSQNVCCKSFTKDTSKSLYHACNGLVELFKVSLDFTTSGHSCERCSFYLNEEKCLIFDNLPELENILSIYVKMSLIYIAGYVARNDEDSDDSYFYYEKFRYFTDEINRGGLNVPGDFVCQWVIYCYIMFCEVADNTCISSLCNLMMLISESYQLNMNRKYGVILSNIFLKNYCSLYSPRSQKEPKQKILKLDVK